ncbi:MAG: VWA domain-containing protein [Clostridia bacterium]|nr:VWA domain-containing protein [Clostridia bacterium]
MKNISFDNPYLLLLAIPALLLVLLPFLFTFRKENRSKSSTVSLILHLLIVVCVILALAGTVVTTVMTETDVYIVADVSHSSALNLELIDEYIQGLMGSLPVNSKVGVVCFGKDYTLLTDMGGEIVSVKEAEVDPSATDIVGALDYTATLFQSDVIKRIVLITDGKQTDGKTTAELITSIESLHTKNISIDAIYLNNNLGADVSEAQISGVDFTPSAYLNHESTANVLLQSNQEAQAIVTLYRNAQKEEERAVTLTKGYNVVNFDLPTSEAGVGDYRVVLSIEGDACEENNTYFFTQSVAGELNVLLITSNKADLAAAERLYGESAVITSYINDPDVPCSVEELCKYDEILLSNVDVRELNNVSAFIDGLDKVVSVYGKSLMTLGDTKIQNKTDDVLKQLEDMLPVKFGNKDQDPKLYGIVIDTSRSMDNAYRLIVAKQAAIQLLNLLKDDDYVTVFAFSGSVSLIQEPTLAVNREAVAKLINDIPPTQGTCLGAGLKAAYDMMKDLPFGDKQVMLISDGKSYALENDDPVQVAQAMTARQIAVSVIDTFTNSGDATQMLKDIAAAGGGVYYHLRNESSLMDLVFTEIADDVTETVIEEKTEVEILRPSDEALDGVSTLPDILGYIYSKAKTGTTQVLGVDFVKTGGAVVEVPLYAYWGYGNGRVASFTSSITDWTDSWQGNDGETFLKNLLSVNTPVEQIHHPYTLNVEKDGVYATLELIPATLNPYASASVTVTHPDGSAHTQQLVFDSTKYCYAFSAAEAGKYTVSISYSYNQYSFVSDSYFHVSYLPEYDSFTVFEASALYTVVRNRGTVSENGRLTITNDEKEIATYTVDYTVPLLIAAIVLYVADIIIRKLKWSDIKSLFGKGRSKGGAVK